MKRAEAIDMFHEVLVVANRSVPELLIGIAVQEKLLHNTHLSTVTL